MNTKELSANSQVLLDQRRRAIDKANEEIVKRCVLEVEIGILKEELQRSYNEISLLKAQLEVANYRKK